MLYSFLSESGVLDISLLALSTGIIVLSILGLLHLGKRRGHNKAGHFSEQPDDCAMPAVQTENRDRKSTRLNSSHNRESRMPSSA